MDAGFRTPLLDTFKQGHVEIDVRLQAARGELAPRPHEQLALLVMLVADPDPEVAATAEATLAAIPPASLAAHLGRGDVPSDIRAFFQSRGIEPDSGAPVDADAPLVDTGATPPAVETADASDGGSTTQRLSAMNVAQRLGRA